jgi:hypothetical protein
VVPTTTGAISVSPTAPDGFDLHNGHGDRASIQDCIQAPCHVRHTTREFFHDQILGGGGRRAHVGIRSPESYDEKEAIMSGFDGLPQVLSDSERHAVERAVEECLRKHRKSERHFVERAVDRCLRERRRAVLPIVSVAIAGLAIVFGAAYAALFRSVERTGKNESQIAAREAVDVRLKERVEDLRSTLDRAQESRNETSKIQAQVSQMATQISGTVGEANAALREAKVIKVEVEATRRTLEDLRGTLLSGAEGIAIALERKPEFVKKVVEAADARVGEMSQKLRDLEENLGFAAQPSSAKLKRLAGTWECRIWRYDDAQKAEIVIRTQKILIDDKGAILLLEDSAPTEKFKIGDRHENQVCWIGGASFWLYNYYAVVSFSPDFKMFAGVGWVDGPRIKGKRIDVD